MSPQALGNFIELLQNTIEPKDAPIFFESLAYFSKRLYDKINLTRAVQFKGKVDDGETDVFIVNIDENTPLAIMSLCSRHNGAEFTVSTSYQHFIV
jgi:hypothetical protein